MFSVRLLNATPCCFSVVTVSMRCLRERPNLSSRQTMKVSPSRRWESACLSPGRSDLTPVTGSLPCLRPAHHIDRKGLRSGIDLRRIPHKMLETPASHKEEPDAWILNVSKP